MNGSAVWDFQSQVLGRKQKRPWNILFGSYLSREQPIIFMTQCSFRRRQMRVCYNVSFDDYVRSKSVGSARNYY